MKDVVLGIDASTTAVKVLAFTREGAELAHGKRGYPLSNPLPGHFEQDPEDWWQALIHALKDVSASVDPTRIAALSIAHQRETFTLIDQAGEALIPAILWLDERARPQVAKLSEEIGAGTIRDWSGKPPDPTPALYGLAWLHEHDRKSLNDAAWLVDVHGFLVHRLTGENVTSVASADPLGLIDMMQRNWHGRLVAAAGLRADQLQKLTKPSEVCGFIREDIAGITGLLAGTPVVAGAGDGQAAGLGMGVVAPQSAYLSLGSGVVSGMYAEKFLSANAFRTLTAPGQSGYMMETVLRSGMQLVDWIVRTTNAGPVEKLEAEATKIQAGSGGLMVLPYWSGVMNPYWDEAARGAILGLSLDHKPAHLFRAVLEGIALEQAIATDALEKVVGHRAKTMTAAGGGIKSKLLMQILASALNRPLQLSPANEAAALGAAMLAAIGAGWFKTSQEASKAMGGNPSDHVEPFPQLVSFYSRQKEIYRGLHFATREINGKLQGL